MTDPEVTILAAERDLAAHEGSGGGLANFPYPEEAARDCPSIIKGWEKRAAPEPRFGGPNYPTTAAEMQGRSRDATTNANRYHFWYHSRFRGRRVDANRPSRSRQGPSPRSSVVRSNPNPDPRRG